jgi:hypothetical protein
MADPRGCSCERKPAFCDSAADAFGDAARPCCTSKTKQERKEPVMSERAFNPADLGQFIGTEHWYRHGINRKVLFTDGAKYVADTAGAYGLLDEIAIIQPHDKRVAAEAVQVWRLSVHPSHLRINECVPQADW